METEEAIEKESANDEDVLQLLRSILIEQDAQRKSVLLITDVLANINHALTLLSAASRPTCCKEQKFND